MARRKKNGVAELVLMGAANPNRVRHDALWHQARKLLKGNHNPNRWDGPRRILTGQRNAAEDRINWMAEMVARLEESYRGLKKAGWTHVDALRETLAHSKAGRGAIAEFKKRIKNPWVQFNHEGFTYRTDGKIVEALDGKTWNRTGSLRIWQVAQEVFHKKQNPDAIEKAADLYEDFHGKSPSEVVELQEADTVRKTYTALGDLVDLTIETPDGKGACIQFTGDGVKVASAPGGKQLYLIGGAQSLDSELEKFGADAGKDFVELGRAVQITYRARKGINDFRLVDYYHDLGEESGNPPLAFYDRLRQRIYFVGGSYHIEAPGIID